MEPAGAVSTNDRDAPRHRPLMVRSPIVPSREMVYWKTGIGSLVGRGLASPSNQLRAFSGVPEPGGLDVVPPAVFRIEPNRDVNDGVDRNVA